MSKFDRDRRVFYLLVEESDREFLARCLMAVIAASQGYDVVIGPQWLIWDQLEHLPPGVMLFKGNNKIQASNMHRAKQAGHRVASIEEEVLGLAGEAQICFYYPRGALSVCDLFLVQGQFQAECLARHIPAIADRMVVVGNPRVDLLRAPYTDDFQRHASHLRDKHGAFVLLNTNFGAINPAHGDSLSFSKLVFQVGVLDENNPGDRAYFMDRLSWERDNAKAMIQFAHGLAARQPGTRIVLRPHPAESMERWYHYLGANAPVSLIRDGGHLPWMLASKAMIHTGCTTGLEAAILGTPTLSLMPGNNPWHTSAISNLANPTARTVEEALDRVIAHLDDAAGADLRADMRELDYAYHLSVDPTTLSARRVVDALVGLHGRLDLMSTTNPPTIESSPNTPLQDWQSHKYTITLQHARRSVASVSAALGYSQAVEVDTIAGGAILIRAA
jgi:surface carbohydrate biosynthesis protein